MIGDMLFQLKLVSGTNKTINGTTLEGTGDIVVQAQGATTDPSQITITTTVSITTDTLGNLGQNPKKKENVIIDNGVKATCKWRN
jgi:hypothetical protein